MVMEGSASSPTNSSGLVASTVDEGGILFDAGKIKTIDLNEPAHKCARKERKLILGLKRMTHGLKLGKSPETEHKRACEERSTHDLSKLEKSPLLHNGKIYNELCEQVSPYKLARLKRKYLLQSKQRMPLHFMNKATPMAELSPHRHAELRTMDVLSSKQNTPHSSIEEGTSVLCESPRKEALRELEATLIVGEPQQARRIRKEILNAKRCGRHEKGQQCQRKCATQTPQCRLRIRAERRRQRLREKKGQMTEEQLIMLRARKRQNKRNLRARLTEEQSAAVRERCRRRYIESTSRLKEKPTTSLDTGNCFPEPIECLVEVPILEVDQSHTPHCTEQSTDLNNLQLPMGHLREVPIIEVRNVHELEGMLRRSGYNSTVFSFGTLQ